MCFGFGWLEADAQTDSLMKLPKIVVNKIPKLGYYARHDLV